MSKILFAPFSMLGGLLAGAVARKSFERIWKLIDGEPAPAPEEAGASWGKLAVGLVLQGAVFSAVRGLFDRGSRELFSRATGAWPGERRTQQQAESADGSA